MPERSMSRHAVPAAPGDPRSRRIRRRALLLSAVALAFYVGFIALTIYRSRRG